MEKTDHTNACSQIQNFANISEIENLRNKDHKKISESTVPKNWYKRLFNRLNTFREVRN